MGRKALAPATTVGPDFVGATPADMAAQEANVRQMVVVANENAQAMAEQLGYDGALSVGALEDEIRFYQRRTAEACIELGKRMLLLKELTPHGEFMERIKLLGFGKSTAYRFMQSAKKFSKLPNLGNLAMRPDSAGKFLELLVLDDDELTELSEEGSVLDITLDKIDCMTASELRTALREARKTQEATERIIASKDAKLNELAIKPKAEDWPDQIKGLNGEIGILGSVVDEALGKHLTLVDAIELLVDAENPESAKHQAAKSCIHRMGEQIERICTLAAGLRSSYDMNLSGFIALDKMHVLEDQDADAVAG